MSSSSHLITVEPQDKPTPKPHNKILSLGIIFFVFIRLYNAMGIVVDVVFPKFKSITNLLLLIFSLSLSVSRIYLFAW